MITIHAESAPFIAPVNASAAMPQAIRIIAPASTPAPNVSPTIQVGQIASSGSARPR